MGLEESLSGNSIDYAGPLPTVLNFVALKSWLEHVDHTG